VAETMYILNLSQVERGLDDFGTRRVPGVVRDVHRRIALAILQGCVMGTPVDKGTARGGWDVVARASSVLTGRDDRDGSVTVSIGRAKIDAILGARSSEFTILYVQNNVHYIGILENTPHSAQNTGWVKATVRAAQAFV
jgi:hypothetical protein